MYLCSQLCVAQAGLDLVGLLVRDHTAPAVKQELSLCPDVPDPKACPSVSVLIPRGFVELSQIQYESQLCIQQGKGLHDYLPHSWHWKCWGDKHSAKCNDFGILATLMEACHQSPKSHKIGNSQNTYTRVTAASIH